MSIHCTKRIWDHATQGGPALLLLLALADYADADGFAFPGQHSLAAKVRLSVRHTRRLLAALRANGHLLILDRPGRSSLYVILTGTDRHSLAAALDRARSFGADVPASTLSDTLDRLPDRHPQPPAASPAPSGTCAATPDTTMSPPSPDNLSATSDNLSPTPDTVMSPPTPDTTMSHTPDNPSPTSDNLSPTPDTVMSSDPSLSLMDPSLVGKWERTLALLQLQMTKATFDQNLRGSRVVAADGERLTIQLRNRYALGWVQNRLARVVSRALSVYLPGMTAHFVPPPVGPPQSPCPHNGRSRGARSLSPERPPAGSLPTGRG
ncbi:MAG TPA: helix-turn-helix domain-containing protein [Anaerolineae bacterium]|nr:helix-turn-helix domain-containing protein [Anaerolineae bacterium]